MGDDKKTIESNTEAYDRRIREFVPCYEEMMNSVIGCLPKQQNTPTVLELGCGSGNLSQKLLNETRDCRLVAVDLFEKIVEGCRERVAQYSNRAEVFCADIIEFERGNAFDYVLSNLALHYPKTAEKKISVCRNVHRSLRQGGIFSFSVILNSDSPEFAIKIWKRWERHVSQNGISREQLGEWYTTIHGKDRPVSPSLWVKWLKEVGFEYCEVIWREAIFGTIWAKKP